MFNSAEEKDIEQIVIEGEVCDITYQNDDNGYAVFDVESDGQFITMTGIVPSLFVGEKIKVSGVWTNHQTYGEQFKVSSFEKSMPTDAGAMLKYLASGTIKGIGPKTAERIIDKFGDSTFEVLESAPDMLCEVKGISPKRAREICESFNAQFGMRRVMMFFSQYFGPTLSAKIYKKWGSAAVELVQSNAYRLCDEIQGIGFEKADSIALSLGTPKTSLDRVSSGIKYVLNFNAYNNGHTHLPYSKLVNAATSLLEVEEKYVTDAINMLEAKKEISVVASNEDAADCAIFEMYQYELFAAKKLMKIASFNAEIGFTDTNALIDGIEESEQIKYSLEQRAAINEAMKNSLYVLTGGPGTGKTTIIKAIIKILNTLGLSFELAAPTGRAAKRMTESTSYEARTIHRLLEYEFSVDEDEARFSRDEANPIDADVVIIDECSMIDLPLFSSLVNAIRPSTRLILIGDYNQLPSVGPGNILRDIIESGVFKVGNLTEIYRRDATSAISVNAHKIKDGVFPDLSNKSSDFFFMPRFSSSSVLSTVVELVKTRLPAKYGEEIASQIQILCPMKKSDVGTKKMNEVFQNIQNPKDSAKREIKVRDIVLREGDKVIQTKNNYNISWEKETLFSTVESGAGVFNGDIGFICGIDSSEESVKVDFDGKIATYDMAALDDLDHAYAITIHKSQGSEYPLVIIPLLKNSPLLLTRNLLYTAITRAKNMVIIVGDREALDMMIQNTATNRRYTRLVDMLRILNEGS